MANMLNARCTCPEFWQGLGPAPECKLPMSQHKVAHWTLPERAIVTRTPKHAKAGMLRRLAWLPVKAFLWFVKPLGWTL